MEIGAIIGYLIGAAGLGFTFYSTLKKNAKDAKDESLAVKETEQKCAIDTTTVLIRLESIQTSINRMADGFQTMQAKMESIDHRLTVAETKLALGVTDGRNLGV